MHIYLCNELIDRECVNRYFIITYFIANFNSIIFTGAHCCLSLRASVQLIFPYLHHITPMLFCYFQIPSWSVKDQHVPVPAGTWPNVVGAQTGLMTVSKSPWTLSPLSYKKYTQTCHVQLHSFKIPQNPTFSWFDGSKIHQSTDVGLIWPRTTYCIKGCSTCIIVYNFKIFEFFCIWGHFTKIIKFQPKRMPFRVFILPSSFTTDQKWTKNSMRV